jgi:predicted site-specific integrase-resolvase
MSDNVINHDNDNYKTSKQAAEELNVHPNTLRRWDREGKIDTIVSDGGHRRYNITKFKETHHNLLKTRERVNICYCRVSSPKQRDDLERQVQQMSEQFPDYQIISDIGSGLNYKRKGLAQILDYAMSGTIETVVVAHRDRLCRFGFDLIEGLIRRGGGKLMVLSKINNSPEDELVQDITSIMYHFSAKMHGKRRYKKEGGEEETDHLYMSRIEL